MPALLPYIIEPIWEQLVTLLPEREVHRPLSCHRPRIPDRVSLRETGTDPGVRLRLREDRRRELLGYHAQAPP